MILGGELGELVGESEVGKFSEESCPRLFGIHLCLLVGIGGKILMERLEHAACRARGWDEFGNLEAFGKFGIVLFGKSLSFSIRDFDDAVANGGCTSYGCRGEAACYHFKLFLGLLDGLASFLEILLVLFCQHNLCSYESVVEE